MSSEFSEEQKLDQDKEKVKNEGQDQELGEEDIEFDDDIDIDQLQERLKEHMAETGIEYVTSGSEDNSTPVEASKEDIQKNIDKNEEIKNFVKSLNGDDGIEQNENVLNFADDSDDEKPRIHLGEKKYIVYIEPENLEFMDGLSIKDRKKLINRILREEDSKIKREKVRKERLKFINQVIIMVFTVVISLPIFFMLLNKSIELTILNYQQSQQNFVRLYKEQGKVKSYKKFKENFN